MPSLISANELLALQSASRDHALLDVRERYEYDSQHIPGSLSLPRGVLEFAIDRTCPSRHATLVAYCDDGKRSALAAETLHSLHYEDVRVISGGLGSWTERNLPVLKGNSLTAKIYAEKLAVRDKVKFTDPGELARTLGVQAYKWFTLALGRFPASGGIDAMMHDNCVKWRDKVAAMITPAQVAEAQRLSSEWKPN